MRKIAFILILSLILASCAFTKAHRHTGDLKLEAKNEGWKLIDGKHRLLVTALIQNPSDDTAYFLNMTCLYECVFITNSSEIVVPWHACNQNITAYYDVPPHQEHRYDLLLESIDCDQYQWSFRLGFKWFIRKKGTNRSLEKLAHEGIRLVEGTEYNKLIWSNPISIN